MVGLAAVLFGGWAHAAHPWETPRMPAGAPIPPGVGDGSAAACGACHPAIAAEWAASTHAHAWTDRQFQAERAKDPAVAWLCDNCHTPLARQQPVLSRSTGAPRAPERSPNPAFSPTLQAEGVTCLSCHWRPAGIAAVHADADAPHPLVVDPALREVGTCTGCHQATARLEPALVCTFDTGAEWEAAAPGKTCVECHMPRVTRAHATGAPVREGGRHLWPGGLIPKEPWTDAEAALFADWVPGVALRVDAPTQATPGQPVTVRLHLLHNGAGHRVPSGDPERFLRLDAEARGPDGAVLARTGYRVGQVWEWWPEARRLSDNRLHAGEDRVVDFTFVMPDAPVSLAVVLEHHRISAANAAHHGLDGYPTHRRVAESFATIRPAP